MALHGGAVRHGVVALALLGTLVPTPARADQFGCGGSAPVTLECQTQFVIPAPIKIFVAGGSDGWPFEGRVGFILEGPTGRHSFSCLIVTVPGIFVPRCSSASRTGHFSIGQTLTLRGEMQGVGNWHVYVVT